MNKEQHVPELKEFKINALIEILQSKHLKFIAIMKQLFISHSFFLFHRVSNQTECTAEKKIHLITKSE